MVSDALLSELERQEKYLAQLPEDYEFPLFNARQAVESQRRSGYKDTAAASREIVDNAIEACATRVDVVFDTVKASNGKRLVSAVAFIDNGAGMSPAMARFALSWGGGTHFEDPQFIGRFGFGLPNSSINRETKLNDVSRYCTQYSSLGYVPLRLWRNFAKLKRPNTWLMISGAVMFWKMRQSAWRVRNQNQGTTWAW